MVFGPWKTYKMSLGHITPIKVFGPYKIFERSSVHIRPEMVGLWAIIDFCKVFGA